MRGFVDLHCHWIAGIDDGARSADDGLAMLEGLYAAGFSIVVATPHMRPGMFDNDRAALAAAYAAMDRARAEHPRALPDVALSSEHFFDDVVFERLRRGEALPYPALDGAGLRAAAAGSVLVELGPDRFPPRLQERFFDLRRVGLRPVLAHPERYAPVWKDDACLDPLLDAGAHLLLDVCALVGKYGRASQKAAERLLDDGAYEAACSDAHKPADVDVVVRAVARLEVLAGKDEARRLLSDGPRGVLAPAAGPDRPRRR
jgi:protein-tyrosine phosphatase